MVFAFSRSRPYATSRQIGLESSESEKCSQRFEIDHFCQGSFSAIQPSKFFLNLIREAFVSQLDVRYTYKTELKPEKSSESEVGVLRVARVLYRL